MPFSYRRPPSRSSAHGTSLLTGAAILCWIVCFSMPTLVAFTTTNQTHLSSGTMVCPVFNTRIYGGKTSHDGAILIQDTIGNWHRLCLGKNMKVWTSGIEGARSVAEVVCRQSGYLGSNASVVFKRYDSEKLQIAYKDMFFYVRLECIGNENHLSECSPYNRQFKEDDFGLFYLKDEACYFGVACQDDMDFAVTLEYDEWTHNILAAMNTTGYVRASGLPNATAYGWVGHVCASFSDSESRARIAQVFCRQMGYRSGFSIRTAIISNTDSRTPFSTVNDFITSKACIMPLTKCTGQEKSIAECDHNRTWGSFTYGAMQKSDWAGYPVPTGCTRVTDDTFEISTSKNLNKSTSDPHAVYIRHGSAWFPVIDSESAHTCHAVCKSLNRNRTAKAICYPTLIDNQVLSQSEGYVASIYCNQNETDLERCAHHIELLNMDASPTTGLRRNQLHAVCEGEQYQTSDLTVTTDLSVTHSGCLVINVNGTICNIDTERKEDNHIIATNICKQYQQGRNLIAAATAKEIEVNKFTIRRSFSKKVPCQSPLLVMGCSSNESSASRCAYVLKNKDLRTKLFNDAGLMIFCAYGPLELHLTANFTAYDGRLEFWFQNGRAFVDFDGWNAASAAVACRQLGFSNNASREIKKLLALRRIEWVMTNIKCDGHEDSLMACSHTWKAIEATSLYVAGVVCKENMTLVTAGLINGSSNSGFVTIRANAGIAYICSDSNPEGAPNGGSLLSDAVGILLCKKAGITRVKTTSMLFFDGANHLPNYTLAYKNFYCKGTESSLEECSHDGVVEISSCSDNDSPYKMTQPQVLALRCDQHEFGSLVRLVGGSTPFEGHVEILYKGQWGAICDDSFGIRESTVVCRQIFGSKSKGRPVHGSKFATKNEIFHLDEVMCLLTDETLNQCMHSLWGDHDCGPCDQVGVVCQVEQFIHHPTVALTSTGKKQQLICSADGFPLPSYQWLIAGALTEVSGDSIEVQCNDSGTVVYICNAHSEAGERFTQITIDAMMGCIQDTDNRVTSALASALSFVTIGFIGVLLYALWLRRILAKVTHDEMGNSVAYSTMSLPRDTDS